MCNAFESLPSAKSRPSTAAPLEASHLTANSSSTKTRTQSSFSNGNTGNTGQVVNAINVFFVASDVRFHRGDPYPIYQWLISKNIRQYSPKIESFVDKDFSVDDELTRFRAIRLKSPTIGLNGQYECSVHSLDSHDIRTTELVVYGKED